jgi:hypothetical protein
MFMHQKGGNRAIRTFLAAAAFSKRSSRAFSFCFLFLRRVSGISMSCGSLRQTRLETPWMAKHLTATVGTL